MFFVAACNSQEQPTKNDRANKKQDVLIQRTIRKWLEGNEVSWFERNRYYCNDTAEGPQVIIDTVLYDGSRTKLYAIVIIASDTCKISQNDKDAFYSELKGGTVYDARGIIGFKDSITSHWSFYHYSPLIQQGFLTQLDISKQTRAFFFSEFKNRSMQSRVENGRPQYQKIGFNINDDDFWTKSFVWQKDLIIPGYYNFQVEDVVANQPPRLIKLP